MTYRSLLIFAEYVKAPVLTAKLFGLILALGSRLPVGKEGPFIHIACMIAIQLCKAGFRVNHQLKRYNEYFGKHLFQVLVNNLPKKHLRKPIL